MAFMHRHRDHILTFLSYRKGFDFSFDLKNPGDIETFFLSLSKALIPCLCPNKYQFISILSLAENHDKALDLLKNENDANKNFDLLMKMTGFTENLCINAMYFIDSFRDVLLFCIVYKKESYKSNKV